MTAARLILLCVLLWATGCGDEVPPASSDTESAGVEATATGGPLEITARAAPAEVAVGSPITLTIEVVAPAGVVVSMPELGDELGVFTIGSRETPPDVPVESGRRWTHRYVLDTFAVGAIEIPALEVGYTTGGGAEAPAETATVGPLTVFVTSVRAGEDDLALRDIRPAVVPTAEPADRPWPWLAAAGGVLLIAAATTVILLRRRTAAVPLAPPTPPGRWARDALARLEAEGLVEAGEHEAFHVRLTDIVRGYVERRYGLHAPDQTTEEFLPALERDERLEVGHRALLRRFLQAADLIKFARVVPTDAESREAFAAASGFVEQTAPAEEPAP